jgi:hypothetical protein
MPIISDKQKYSLKRNGLVIQLPTRLLYHVLQAVIGTIRSLELATGSFCLTGRKSYRYGSCTELEITPARIIAIETRPTGGAQKDRDTTSRTAMSAARTRAISVSATASITGAVGRAGRARE